MSSSSFEGSSSSAAAGNGSRAPAVLRFRVLGTTELRDAAGNEVRALLVQPKRLALFAYLALSGAGRLLRRDALIALFWPESPSDRARLSLRQTLHFFRNVLGADVVAIRGDDEVGIDRQTVWCDVTEFERAIAEGRRGDALALYRGPFLQGFHIPSASPEWEQWLEDERARLHSLARDAAFALTDEADRAGDLPLALQWARAAAQLAPLGV